MEAEILDELRRRIVKTFMDMVVLAELRNRPMSGYDAIAYIHKRFHILVSSGTVYSLLYSMERDGVIRGMFSRRKRTYSLTDKGKETVKIILNANEKIQRFMANVLAGR